MIRALATAALVTILSSGGVAVARPFAQPPDAGCADSAEGAVTDGGLSVGVATDCKPASSDGGGGFQASEKLNILVLDCGPPVVAGSPRPISATQCSMKQ